MELTEIETPVEPPVPVRFNTFARDFYFLVKERNKNLHYYRTKRLRCVTKRQREILVK